MTRFLQKKGLLAFLAFFVVLALSFPPFSTDVSATAPPATFNDVIHRVTIIDDGVATTHDTTLRTVGALLDDLGIEIGRLDTFRPGRSRVIENRLVIEIFRVEDGNRLFGITF